MRSLVVTSICFLALLAAGCTSSFTKLEPVNFVQNLALYKISSDVYPASEELKKSLPPSADYPKLTTEKIIDVLGNLRFRRDTLWGSQERKVFYDAELKYLAPLVADAISKMEKDHRLVIISRYDPDQSVLSRMERVTALLWADEAGLNVVFGEIREEIPNNDIIERDEWTQILPISLKREYPDLALLPSSEFQFKTVLGRQHRTWAIFKLDDLDSIHYAPQKQDQPATQTGVTENSVLTQKLKELQQARDANLISEEEYDAKRKEILKNF